MEPQGAGAHASGARGTTGRATPSGPRQLMGVRVACVAPVGSRCAVSVFGRDSHRCFGVIFDTGC